METMNSSMETHFMEHILPRSLLLWAFHGEKKFTAAIHLLAQPCLGSVTIDRPTCHSPMSTGSHAPENSTAWWPDMFFLCTPVNRKLAIVPPSDSFTMARDWHGPANAYYYCQGYNHMFHTHCANGGNPAIMGSGAIHHPARSTCWT